MSSIRQVHDCLKISSSVKLTLRGNIFFQTDSMLLISMVDSSFSSLLPSSLIS